MKSNNNKLNIYTPAVKIMLKSVIEDTQLVTYVYSIKIKEGPYLMQEKRNTNFL
jgi:hypothetical protein